MKKKEFNEIMEKYFTPRQIESLRLWAYDAYRQLHGDWPACNAEKGYALEMLVGMLEQLDFEDLVVFLEQHGAGYNTAKAVYEGILF